MTEPDLERRRAFDEAHIDDGASPNDDRQHEDSRDIDDIDREFYLDTIGG